MTTPLPNPVDFSDVPEFAHVWGYTADQMRDYGRAEYMRGLEQAATICTNIALSPSNVILGVAIECRDAIRALAGEKT